MSKQVIATRLVAALGVVLGFAVTSVQAQPPGGGFGGGGPQIPLAELEKMPTPKLPSGKPDLTGTWQQAAGGQRRCIRNWHPRVNPS
jgi:hypothetical protein